MNALVFQSATINPVRHQDGQVWVTATDLSKALKYKQSDAVTKIYNRNADEFKDYMTQVIESPHTPNLGVRIFSLRGAHLIAMFARTAVAKEFRKWVLDVIEKKEIQPKKQIDVIEKKEIQPKKQIDVKNYVSKEVHQRLQLKYHRYFRQYDDMIDRLRDQVEEMQRKCRRHDFNLQRGAVTLDVAAVQLNVPVSKLKRILIKEEMIEERNPYIEINKTVLIPGHKSVNMELLFIESELVGDEVQDVIKMTENGMAYLQSMLTKEVYRIA